MSYEQNLSRLGQALDELERGIIPIPAFCLAWRTQAAALAGLPPRYGQVMEDLLTRLEAGSAFTEESCSFSQQDLHASLTIWLEKARQTLAAQSA